VHNELEEIFSQGGLLNQHLEGYELREEQLEMARQIAEAYSKGHIALIEAGTGIGKSLAYLAPAILWALKHNERTVIATHTIALQEQLIEKEIPFLLKILDADVKAALVKGMGNYLCLKKYSELEEDHPQLENWVMRTGDGSRSDVDFFVPSHLWDKISAEPERCTGSKCPHYKPCFFFKARRHLQDAKVLVVNHHLLFADLTAEKDQNILPEFERLILDEAHNLEEIALESLSERVDKAQLIKLLSHKLEVPMDAPSELQVRLGIDLPAQRHNLMLKVEEAFSKLPEQASANFRLKEALPEEMSKCFLELQEEMARFAVSLQSLVSALEKFPQMDNLALDLYALSNRLSKTAETIDCFFSAEKKESRLRWIEKTASNAALCEADLDVSSYLQELIFEKFPTASLCSATLAANREFSFIRSRLGIDKSNRVVSEKIYDSPFDYKNRTFLAVPTDMPEPADPAFLRTAADVVLKAVEASAGSAFVLFTSYEMLNQCYELLKNKIDILRQGDASRMSLLDKFKANKGSILFGTDSFWEGVDVPGDALRLVIIVKLPFKVPDDPIVSAKGDLLKKEGKNPFMDYLLPEAAIKFKQGFGRLMRRKTDRGCIVCLDRRLISKSYGKLFLKSLPNCPVVMDQSAKIIDKIKKFFL
jgi:ATP-dependent DNA helicase DinG